MSISKAEKGFTIIEVIIALLILSTAFTAIIISIQAAAKQQMHLQDKTAALWVASNVISSAQTGMINLNQNIKYNTGTEQMFNKVWHWTGNVVPQGSVTKIIVEVKPEGAKKVFFSLEGFLPP